MAGKTPKKRTVKSSIAPKRATRSKRGKSKPVSSPTSVYDAAPEGFGGPGEQVIKVTDNLDARVMVPVGAPATAGRKVLCIEDGVVFWGTPS